MDAPTHVEIRELRRTWRVGASEVRALDGVDVRILRGEFVAVVGKSGSGKSTLLHLIGGLDTPSAGELRVGDRDLATLSPRERALYRRNEVGFVFQSFHLVPSMTAEANVALALTIGGTWGDARRRLALDALNRVGLAHRARHRPGQLSGGEQQRVAVARAIARRPPLLLADEPTGNLDSATAEDVLSRLRALHHEDGSTVVLVTHDEDAARSAAQRIVRLRDGRVVGEERT